MMVRGLSQSIILVIISLSLYACSLVRQEDLDAWVGVPVVALDTHSIFITIPMFRTVTKDGIEIRNYANSRDVASCFNMANASGTTYVNSQTFSACSSRRVGCNNIFYIKDGYVVEYAPTGSCYTNKLAQPEPRYKKFID
ncbi:MAG: hypothetical protein AB2697_19870 [Candidatus Thiodiazotropha endolucinida]